ncbi:MAG: glycosyltransferase family 4 protein [Pseudomonadota bacterium]
MSTRKLQQLNVAHFVYFMGHGGLESRIRRLIAGWHDLNVRFFIVSFRAPEDGDGSAVLPSNVEHIELALEPGVYLSTIRRLKRLLKQSDVHIAHTHNWVTMFEGVIAARLASTPVILHGEHGAKIFEADQFKTHRALAQRFAGWWTNGIVCVNQPIATQVCRQWGTPERKIEVIENGVDIKKFGPNPAINDDFTVGTIGRLVEVKDFPTLIEAMAKLKEKSVKVPVKCRIVGAGPECKRLTELIDQFELGDCCYLEGATDQPESWYQQFDAYVNCSSSEGMSNTVLEAMASGLPVICSDVEGHRAWVHENENCLYFRSGDAANLAARIEELALSKPLCKKLSENNRRRVELEYDNTQFLGRYTELYRRKLLEAGLEFEGFNPLAP